MIGGLLLALGPFLPFFRITDRWMSLFRFQDAVRTEVGLGVEIVVLPYVVVGAGGLCALLGVLTLFRGARVPLISAVVVSSITLALLAFTGGLTGFTGIFFATFDSTGPNEISIGFGCYLTILGGGLTLAGSVLGLRDAEAAARPVT